MAKFIFLNLSPQIKADFESCFETKEKERAYLYQKATKKVNDQLGDAFIKRKIVLRLIEGGKQITKDATLDEIDFEKSELPSHPEWVTKDIGGKLEPYEYLIGDAFWQKICNWAKLMYILNVKYNTSMIADTQRMVEELKSDGKIPEAQIRLQEERLEKSKQEMEKGAANECIELYTHNLLGSIIFEKIQANEQAILDKEQAELNKPPPKKSTKE